MQPEQPETQENSVQRIRKIIFGAPKLIKDPQLFHKMSLIPVLAWVGLGADGLSSSSYGPEEAFRALGSHTYLAILLGLATALTVFIISAGYSRIIEHFPHGGGGYVVATKLLGERAGVVSGCALLVDYVLTIAISIAAAGDALFSFLPLSTHFLKVPTGCFLISLLLILNFRGVKESVLALTPIFLLFVLTHLVLIGGGLIGHAGQLPETLHTAAADFSAGWSTLGATGLLLIFIHAYSLGGGTYTGIEAVSNGLSIMREPHVRNGKRTMLYMAVSLAFTASGLLLCYLLWDLSPADGKTMNAVFAEKFFGGGSWGATLVVLTLLSEGAILVVAAQAGFVDGPRVLANMAIDSWVPRRFAALSDRLTIQNGIMLMGGAALVALLYTHGDVRHLVVMYSINVFITFSMTEFAMCRFYLGGRREHPDWKRKISIHVVGLSMCVTILVVTVFEKFLEGGWLTLLITGACIACCFWIRGHYRTVRRHFVQLERDLRPIESTPPVSDASSLALSPDEPTAVVLVGGYSGLGVHTILHIHRSFPNYFKNLVFVSVAVVDSGAFKGRDELDALRAHTEEDLQKYVALSRRLGFAATARSAIGTEVVQEAVKLCQSVAAEFSRCVFFSGQIVFQKHRWYQPILHNQTAFAIQRKLQWHDMTMVILPIRVRE